MFCSWKTGLNASCGCAFRLESPIDELLNHLSSLGKGTLILRRPGMSVAKTTPFGRQLCGGDWGHLRDAVSGLETDLAAPQRAYLLREMSDSCPLFVMGPPGEPIEFTVRLEGHSWQSAAMREMIAKFHGKPLDCLESRRLGAGAWLDEWGQPVRSPAQSASALIHETSTALHRCRSLEVEIRTTTHRSTMCFQPSFIDSEGSVLRIADRSRTHIVYADVSAREFQLSGNGARHLRLAHI